MRDIKLIVLLAVLTPFCYIDTVNGSWIYQFLGFKYPHFQQRTVDQANLQNDIIETAPTQFPFPAFYVYLRPKFRNPLKPVSKEVNERNDLRAGKSYFGKHAQKNEETKNIKTSSTSFLKYEANIARFIKAKVNDSIHGKINNATGDIVEEIEPTSESHYVKTKFMERFSHAQFLKKIFYPLNRISPFRHSNSNFFENQKRPERKRREVEKQTIPLNVHFEILNVNETEVATPNSSTTNEKGNCSSHFTPDCLLIWSVDWKSLTLSVIFIVILLFFLYILFVCCLYVGGLFLVSYFVLLGLFLFRLRRRKKDVFTQTNTVANPLTV